MNTDQQHETKSIPLPDLTAALTAVHELLAPPRLAPPTPSITGIALDSRQVHPGALFVALPGGSRDGHAYIGAAIERGAAAVAGTQALGDLRAPDGRPVPYLQVRDGRRALAYLSAAFYGYPARRLTVIGVTGTDGKTTTSNLIYHILQAAGLRAGMISTVNALIGGQALDTGFHVTTPEAPDVQRYLAQMVDAGLTHVVLEATSHGLAQERVTACDFDLGVLTNITHEHLDYHGSWEAYRDAKARLFTSLAETPLKPANPARGAVLNLDERAYEHLAGVTHVPQVSYGLSPAAQVRAEDIVVRADGTQFSVAGLGAPFRIATNLAGEFNVLNTLAAVTLARAFLDLPVDVIQAGVRALPGVPGRMEKIDLGQNFTAIVDFAHTPNALRVALQAARRIAGEGRVIAVFGSAGLRDRQKRRMMAETAAELADISILTAEDPRTESLDAILAEMASGAESRGGVEGRSFFRQGHRPDALRLAVRLARPGDLVIACGKGHEQSMCFGEQEYLWDDRTALRAALAEHLGVAGPEMPFLPVAL